MTFCCDNPYQTISKNKDLSIFKSLIDLAGLKNDISKLKKSTIFAPTNQGLENYPAGLIKYLTDPANRELLRSVLLYHITGEGAFTTQQLESSKVLKMNNGRNTTIYRALYYNFVPVVQDLIQQNIDVVEGNIATYCNNYIQKIGGLLLPEQIYYPQVLNPRYESGEF
jgi:uncharacterized surface protein with fasciclin (FAS1) repeats